MPVDRALLEQVAERFFAAAEAGDEATLIELYSPDVRVWHSRDSAETDLNENLELLKIWWSRAHDIEYELVRRFYGDNGWMQQHIARGTLADGGRLEIPVSFVALVDDDGKIVRIEEYCNHLLSPLNGISQAHA